MCMILAAIRWLLVAGELLDSLGGRWGSGWTERPLILCPSHVVGFICEAFMQVGGSIVQVSR